MSTLKVTNIQATGETASRAVSGVAAAWVNFNGTGTIAARDSVNVSSLTDNSTGNYSVNYTNNLASSNYTVAAASDGSATTTYLRNLEPIDLLSTRADYKSAETVNGGSVVTVDKSGIYATAFGDLA